MLTQQTPTQTKLPAPRGLYAAPGAILNLNPPTYEPEFDFTVEDLMQDMAFINRYQRAYGGVNE